MLFEISTLFSLNNKMFKYHKLITGLRSFVNFLFVAKIGIFCPLTSSAFGHHLDFSSTHRAKSYIYESLRKNLMTLKPDENV